jgi:putative oxidoreductase
MIATLERSLPRDRLAGYAPEALAILRIVTGVLFVHSGIAVLFNIPASTFPPPPPGMATLMTIAGILELVGGALIFLGFLTRPVAFILCGMMAVAYWGFHVPMNPWPTNNLGVAAILYCFIFFYFFFAGPGAWSVDGIRRGSRPGA